ncbi:endothelin-2-like [Arapaima gigas]
MVLYGLTALVLALSVSLQPQQGAAVSVATETGSDSQLAPHRVRAKRCSCSNWLDKECIYFCHLDIIWVNTASKTLPYGLGRVASRRRRAASRCQCVHPGDLICATFCHDSFQDRNLQKKHLSQSPESRLLTALRQELRTDAPSAERYRTLGTTPPRGGPLHSR